MQRDPICAILLLLLLISPSADSEDEEVKQALVKFLDNVIQAPVQKDVNFGWNLTTDPCIDKWVGVTCDSSSTHVKNIVLNGFNLTGVLDTASLCVAQSLFVVSLQNNRFQGLLTEGIGKCRSLTHLYINGNTFSGDLPNSLAKLVNLKRLDIADNRFSGVIPDLSSISGLITFRAQNNNLSGQVPIFDFSNLVEFNVSNNNLSGPIPDVKDHFQADSFLGNPKLCGSPLLNACPPPSPSQTSPPPPPPSSPGRKSSLGVGTYAGFLILGALVLFYLIFKFVMYCKSKRKASNSEEIERLGVNTNGDKSSRSSHDSKNTKGNRSEYSASSDVSSSLTILSTPVFKELRFQELLRAPAQLIGRGKHGGLYKVMLEKWPALVVKRIKDWQISKEEFEWRMFKIDKVKHPYVLPPIAFYCSHQEKLLVYEYQQNGSLFQLLHGSQNGRNFDWGSRLHVAACIAEGLSHMHHDLQGDRLAHGNLKSTNILFNNNIDPCISEYGLLVVEHQDQRQQPIPSQTRSSRHRNTSGNLSHRAFKADVYAYGVLLLELLTGKHVRNNGFDLADWVNSVVREEWTVEVFDKALILNGANEERMVSLLQIAMNCVNAEASDRPNMSEVAVRTLALKEEEEKSIENNI